MEKREITSSSNEAGGMATATATGAAAGPLPSAPPSYEEAVGLMPQQPPHNPMMPPPSAGAALPAYPVAGVAMPMPMPAPMSMPYATATPQMPLHSQVTANQSQVPEVRVIHQHITVTLGPNPVKMTCPSCRTDIKTTTTSDHQPSAHVCCIVLCLLGCCLCSCLPYCLSAFLSVHHFCPSCKAYIGTWKG